MKDLVQIVKTFIFVLVSVTLLVGVIAGLAKLGDMAEANAVRRCAAACAGGTSSIVDGQCVCACAK